MADLQLQRQQIQAQNLRLMQTTRPGYATAPSCSLAPPGVAYPTVPSVRSYARVSAGSQSDRAQQLRRQYYQAQADFLNEKYCPNGPPRFTPESASVSLSTVAPPNPLIMQKPALFNPVIQKYQAAQAIRQELRQVTGSSYP